MRYYSKTLSLILVLALALLSSFASADDAAPAAPLDIRSVVKIDIQSSINPATVNYVVNTLSQAPKKGVQAILITMNTPGGLISSTKEILTAIGSSELPVILWIGPEGASATSAGAIISSAAHLLYMAEGSNIGAATPVGGGGDIAEGDSRRKAINDLVALVEGLAESRGRQPRYFADMIEKSSSFSAQEALQHGIIDGQAASIDAIWAQANGKTIHLKGASYTLAVSSPTIIEISMDPGQRLLDILAHPSLAYVLMLIGAALIYFELQAPGGFIAGAVGALCLGIAAIGMQLLPLNFGALALMLLALILFVLEIFITSYGLLSLAAITSLIVGSLFLFRTDDSYIHLSWKVMFSAVGAIVAFLAFITWFIVRDIRRSKKSTVYQFIGAQAKVMAENGTGPGGEFIYQVAIGGEIWRAQSQRTLNIGQFVHVTAMDNKTLTLTVEA